MVENEASLCSNIHNAICCFSPPVCVCSCADENGKDQGINVRQKVKEMVEFVQDDDRLREERKKAKKNKDKYIGVSSDSMGGGGGGIKNCKQNPL